MWEKIRNNKISLFFLKGGIIYISWLLIYSYIIGPKTTIDERFSTHIIKVSGGILKGSGYDITERIINYETYVENPSDPEFQLILINGGSQGQQGVWVGDACNALSLFSLFAIFIIAFPGSWKKKLWFIPLGILLIHIMNIIRVCALALISFHNQHLLEFNHTYTFTIIVYGFIFILWIWWVNKFSRT